MPRPFLSAAMLACACAMASMPTHALAQAAEAAPAPARAAATLADLDWLVGHWAGTGIDGQPAGETFSYAGEGQMVGHFWQTDASGEIAFYEIITITRDGDSLVMRLKHFEADLAGWEGQAAETALQFPLRERSAARWQFGPVTFTRLAPDRLDVSVQMRPAASGEPVMLSFSYTRVPAP